MGCLKNSLLTLLFAAAGWAGHGQKVRAVVVGVADYRYDHKGVISDLDYSDDDAQEFYDFLVGKYPKSRSSIALLKDGQATKARILAALKQVFDRSYQNDMLIFFFSGHGYNGYFLPCDFDGASNFLYHKEVREIFSLSPAGRKLVFADACRAGSIKIETAQANVPFGLEDYYRELKSKKGGIALMLSSRWDQNSMESGGLKNGFFAYHLLNGLRGGADLDGNGEIVIDELYGYVRAKVTAQTGNKQVPIIFGQFSGQMPVSQTD